MDVGPLFAGLQTAYRPPWGVTVLRVIERDGRRVILQSLAIIVCLGNACAHEADERDAAHSMCEIFH
ncbi:hypothetical protein AO263_23605 [Pseudomonas sp. NZIPFR-PS5]|uniref:Uncharacterized protein n=1 Tax=Pseudomonas graminis TaxID=158627 RepID=A0A1C2EBC7_9PSED|nr:hypothetical protein BBI10_05525 [Pseudomonas graminis]PHX44098.1 hypothetical protein AO263_23605 [Pseudomonas sp. NZIPFR-PS5]